MHKLAVASVIALALTFASPAKAQVEIVAAAGIPAGQITAPSMPGGAALFGNTFMLGDGPHGWHLYGLVDPANTGSANGQLVYDGTAAGQDASLGGQGSTPLCSPFCSVGQVTPLDPAGVLFLTAYDKQSTFTKPAIYRIRPPNGFDLMAPAKGLGGAQPTAVAISHPGVGISYVYLGNLSNGNVIRITNPFSDTSVQDTDNVGNLPGGATSRAMAIVPPAVNGDMFQKLYIAGSSGLFIINAIDQCYSNTGGCGNATVVQDGFVGLPHSGMVYDGNDHLYLAIGGAVWRHTVSTGAMVQVSPSAYSFCSTHTTMMMLDAFGDLLFGDDTSCGAQLNTGRLWRIPAARLAAALPN